MGPNADEVWLNRTVPLFHAFFLFIFSPLSFSPLAVNSLILVTVNLCDTRSICRTGGKLGSFLPPVTEPTVGFRWRWWRRRYLVEEPVDLHPQRLGEQLPAAVELRLVQLLPGELELLVREQRRHDGVHSAPSPASSGQHRQANRKCARRASGLSPETINSGSVEGDGCIALMQRRFSL